MFKSLSWEYILSWDHKSKYNEHELLKINSNVEVVRDKLFKQFFSLAWSVVCLYINRCAHTQRHRYICKAPSLPFIIIKMDFMSREGTHSKWNN